MYSSLTAKARAECHFRSKPFPRRLDSGYEARLLLNDILGGFLHLASNMNLREAHAYTTALIRRW